MKKFDLGQTISILANLGVIAGIVFLGIEIRQNTATLETEMRFNQNERQTEVIEEIIRSPHLNAAITKAVNDEALSREEDLMLTALTVRVFLSFNWQYDEAQRGTMPAEVMANWRQVVHSYPLAGSGFSLYANYWDQAKGSLTPEFREWMDENVIQPGLP